MIPKENKEENSGWKRNCKKWRRREKRRLPWILCRWKHSMTLWSLLRNISIITSDLRKVIVITDL